MEPSSTREHALLDAVVTEVEADPDRRYLVVVGTRERDGRAWTLVLERVDDYWISRRDLDGRFEPAAAVSGHLFGPEPMEDPVRMLRRMNEVVRGEYYRLLQEKMKGDRQRAELVEELGRAKAEGEGLRRQLRRRRPVRASPRRRSSGPSRKRPR